MSELEQLHHALNDWAERIAVEACAVVRERGGSDADRLDEQHWQFFSSAVVVGVSLALQSINKVRPLDLPSLRRLIEETP
jgi:hypothetical protein